MLGDFGPRFAIEAGFLILLGVGAGLADLRPLVIVGLLAGGWLLVSLIELAVWRAQARPVGIVSAPLLPAEPDTETQSGSSPQVADETVAPEDTAYPLRADAGSAPAEEVEEYTRVPGGREAPDESSE